MKQGLSNERLIKFLLGRCKDTPVVQELKLLLLLVR
jgi:hypothetical protein